MVFTICILFVVISIAAFLPTKDKLAIDAYDNKELVSKLLYTLFGILLILISGFRGTGIDRDYLNYINLYNIHKDSWTPLIEPSFLLISKLIKSFLNNNVTALFVIFAILGVSTKMFAIKQLSHFVALPLLIYLSYS